MKLLDLPPPRVRRAIALSIALHLCALCLLAVLAGGQHMSWADEVDGTPDFVIATIVHHRPAVRPRASQSRRSTPTAPRPTPLAARVPASAVVHIVLAAARSSAAHSSANAPAVAGTAPALVPAPSSVPVSAAPPAPLPTIETPSPVRASPYVATPPAVATSPTASPSVARVPVVAANFGGLFSENYPPALADPADLAVIRARHGGHTPVSAEIDIDETGRAIDVRFASPVPDEAPEIRAELLALRYVPADCNGLHCGGTLEIRY